MATAGRNRVVTCLLVYGLPTNIFNLVEISLFLINYVKFNNKQPLADIPEVLVSGYSVFSSPGPGASAEPLAAADTWMSMCWCRSAVVSLTQCPVTWRPSTYTTIEHANFK